MVKTCSRKVAIDVMQKYFRQISHPPLFRVVILALQQRQV